MKRVLLTGLSGTGKSSVILALASRGFKAVDLDSGDYSHWVEVSVETDDGLSMEPGRDWMWREDRVQALLSKEDSDLLFVSGSAPNMGKFLWQFDHVILLSAPVEVTVDRLLTRTNNPYGKKPEQIAREQVLKEKIEPLLRRAAGHEIDTSVRLDEVVAEVLRIVQGSL